MPLETPTVPNSNERTHEITRNAERVLQDQYESDAFFDHAERQVAAHDPNKWDLHEAPRAFDPDNIALETEPYTPAPEYVQEPKTRAQELEESYFYLDDKQLLNQALAISSAMPTMRRLV